MKKRIVIFLLTIGIIVVNQPLFNVSAEETATPIFQKADQIFEDTIEEIEDSSDFKLKYDTRPLYDIYLNECGYFYSFTIDGEEGYAIATGTSLTGYNVEEIFFDCQNPFESDKELAVYVGSMTLLSYKDGVYSDARTNEVILSTTEYLGTSSLVSSYMDEIYYERKVATQLSLSYEMPFYCSTSYLNSCANIAGSNILGFYDKIYTYLIPDYTAFNYTTNTYNDETPAVTAVTNQLYYDMQTNVNNGTSVANFISGLQTYLARVNRSLSYSSVLSSGEINYDAFQLSIAQQRPIAIFMSGYNVIHEFYDGTNGCDWFMTANYSGSHAMIAYGYRNISYYRTETVSVWSPIWYNPFRYINVTKEVNFRNDDYLKVSTGIGGFEKAYLRLDQDNQSIDQALSIYVY